ncbi:MAG: hypothetical protein FWG02_08405 [Holophagaceae bacterium]|nr:hypothetical protein [Holophagaceae bacterium]
MFRLYVLPILCLVLGAQEATYQPRIDIEQGRFLKVLADSDARLAQNSGDALAHAARAQALSALTRFNEALESAQRSLELNPALADALVGRSMAKAGTALQLRNLSSLSRVSQAMGDLKTAVQIDPEYALAWMTLGLGYEQLPGLLGGSSKKALECAERLKQIQPARGNLLHGRILSMRGRWNQAEPFFMKALTVAPGDPEIVSGYLDELGEDAAKRALGEEVQKQKLASEAIRLLPLVKTQARAVESVSQALFNADRVSEAWQVAIEALQNVDAPSIIKLQLGKLSARTGFNSEQGLALLDQAANEPLEGGTGGFATLHWRRGQILMGLNKIEPARMAALQALSFDSKHRGAKELLDNINKLR